MQQCKNTDRVYFDGADGFNFNNETRRFTGNWNDPEARKLWLYNLHTMTWLFDLKEGRESWIQRWIRENPPTHGTGWEPYPVSLRLFNWCKHYALTGTTPSTEVLNSMGRQAGWLVANLEFHLDGNHLLENLFALKYVTFFLDQVDMHSMRALGKVHTLFEQELEKQFLADGGHYELSPMYHAILLERMLDLLNVWPEDKTPLHGLMESKVRAALDWLDTMTVGKDFALFNDSAYDTAPEAGRLLDYGSKLMCHSRQSVAPLRSLHASGYFRAETGPFTLIFDAGKLGPDHQMGHAQGDMLSFCLWLDGKPILAHPGNFEYLPGAMRDYCRSTASHNTVAIEGAEQAEWWAAHRVGWRGIPIGVEAEVDETGKRVRLRGGHLGFDRPPAHAIHRRALDVGEESIVVLDTLSCVPNSKVEAYFHFHPECILRLEGNSYLVSSSAGTVRMESDSPLRLAEGWHCPEFGLRIRNPVLIAEMTGESCRCTFKLESE